MSDALRILILEDRPTDAELMLREVRKAGIECAALRVETEEEFRRQLQEYRPGLILADYRLPTYDGLAALAIAQKVCPDVPFILVSGTLGEDTAVESLHRGATDYILKGRLSRLGPAVRRALLEVDERNDLKRAEQRLRDSETRYRRLFESAKDGVLILDAETGMVVDVNPSLTELLGVSHEQFIGKKVWELGFFKDVVANRANFVELQRKEYIRYEDRALETSDGRHIDVELLSNVYLVNDRKVIQCNIRDITERKRASEALRASQQLIEGILNTISVGVFWKDRSLNYLGCNAVFARDAGFADPKDIVGKDDYQLPWRDHADLNRGEDRQVIESGSAKVQIEEPRTAPDGMSSTILTTKVPLYGPQGEVSGVLGTYVDITERKLADDRIKNQLEELMRWQDVMLGREERVQELKREVNELCRRAGEKTRYQSQHAAPSGPEAVEGKP